MRFKLKNELKKADYIRLTEFLNEYRSASFVLFPGVDFEFVTINPVMVTVESFGYMINGDILFEQPIGFEVFESLKLHHKISECLEINRRQFKLSKIVTEESDLEKDLNMILKTVVRIVNNVCNWFGRLIEQTFTLDSEEFDKQLGVMLKMKELEKRGEIPRSFGTIHAKSSKDAKERAGDLVPTYLERDKAYLYEDKNVFILLPRSFVMKLLKIEGSTMITENQFKSEEIEALKKFSMSNYIKTRKIGGKIHYYNLNEKTRKHLLRGMKKKYSF